MEIEIDLTKSIEENAGSILKLLKSQEEICRVKALADTKHKLELLLKQESKFLEETAVKQANRQKKREWYEKFHWFFSSEGFLCVGGKDATSNEVIIKKHLEKNDLVLHTDMAGSPFFVIKNGQDAGEQTIKETAQAVAAYSRAWKLWHTSADVFYVKPEQVTKEARPGEYLAKGSFMIYGKTNYLHPTLEYAIGLVGGEIIGGPKTAVEKNTKYFAVVIQERKQGKFSQKIKHKLKGGDLDDIIKFLPAGGGELKK